MVSVFIFFVLFIGNIHAQLASIHTFIDSSYNNNFRISVTGNYYEGFSGLQQICLLDKEDKVFWERSFDGNSLRLPRVSNEGIVAVIDHKSLTFINNESIILGNYKLSSDNYFSYQEYDDTFSGFSFNGKSYLIMIGSRKNKSRSLTCFNTITNIIWSYDLANFLTRSLKCFKKGIALHVYTPEEREYTNRFYFFEYSGKIRFLYEPEEKYHVYRFYYDPEKDSFIINFGKKIWRQELLV